MKCRPDLSRRGFRSPAGRGRKWPPQGKLVRCPHRSSRVARSMRTSSDCCMTRDCCTTREPRGPPSPVGWCRSNRRPARLHSARCCRDTNPGWNACRRSSWHVRAAASAPSPVTGSRHGHRFEDTAVAAHSRQAQWLRPSSRRRCTGMFARPLPGRPVDRIRWVPCRGTCSAVQPSRRAHRPNGRLGEPWPWLRSGCANRPCVHNRRSCHTGYSERIARGPAGCSWVAVA